MEDIKIVHNITILVLGLIFSSTLLSQVGPSCKFQYRLSNRTTDPADNISTFQLTSNAGVTTSINNKNCNASAWVMSYSSEGFSALSIQLEDSQNQRSGTFTGPTTWAAWEGTAIDGSNPSTINSSYYSAKGFYPWIRVNLVSSTGTGSIDITLTGWQSPALLSSGSSGGGTFATLTPGTNTLGVFHIGSGSSLDSTGTGTVVATSFRTTPTLCSAGNAPLGILANGNATGCASIGSGVPGGSNKQFQIDNAGAFGGTVGMEFDPAFPGLSLSLLNPTQGNDANDRRGVRFSFTTDSSTNNPNYSNQDGLEILQTSLRGDASYGTGTNAKTTFFAENVSATHYGSGQRILTNHNLTCLGGFSDCALDSSLITYYTGPINGDEGQGFNVVSTITQGTNLAITTIASVPAQTTCNTNSTQVITGSKDVQTVTVASSTNCNVGNYIVIGQEAATGSPNEDAVKITAAAAGQISGIFRNNHISGVTITPATVLALTDLTNFGQDRWLVLTSGGSSYTTGTVASISGGGFTGSSTVWTNSMVGGSALVPGCVSLTNDIYTGSPFDGSGLTGPLNSWYPINSVGSNTGLGIFTTSVAGDAAYHGNGVGSGAYTIKPCARILLLESSAGSLTNNVILETNSFTWTATNTVEAAIRPDPDVAGFQFHMQKFSTGGVNRGFMSAVNTGARTGDVAFSAIGNMRTGGGADTIPWGIGYYIDHANTGFSIGESFTGKAYLATATTRNTTTKRPCYAFQGGVIVGGGLCIDNDTGDWILGADGNPTTSGVRIILDPYNGSDNKTNITAVGHFIFDGSRAGGNGPEITIKSPGTGSDIKFVLNKNAAGDVYGPEYAINADYIVPGTFVRYGAMFEPTIHMTDGANNQTYGVWGVTKAAVSTSAATNAGSNLFWYNASVWTGSAAANRYMFTRASPGVSGNNAHVEWQVAGLDPSTSYNTSQPAVYLGVNDIGIMRFGVENTSAGGPLIMASLDPTSLTANRLFKMPDQAGTFGLVLTGTTGSISGALTAGVCDSGTASITGATTGMSIVVTPVTYPGDGAIWYGYVSSSNTVTVKVCGLTVVTPTASAYNVRVIQ